MLGFLAAMLGMSAGIPAKAISEPRTPTQMLAEGLDPKNKKKPPPTKIGPDPCPDREYRAFLKRERRDLVRLRWAHNYYNSYYAGRRLL